MSIEEPSKVAVMYVHWSGFTSDFELTLCHFNPSKTENIAFHSGSITLLIDSEKAPSLLTMYSSDEPLS